MSAFFFSRVAFQCDPWESLNPQTDTSLLMVAEALRRGSRVFFYTPQTLSWHQGRVTVLGHEISMDAAGTLTPKTIDLLDLGTMDLIWIRQNPPFNMRYISPTYLLDTLPSHVWVLNNPQGLRDCPEKHFTLSFPDLIPPTLVTQNLDTALSFLEEHPDLVLKPLYEFAGRGVVRVKTPSELKTAWYAHQQKSPDEGLLLQTFLPQVYEGDRRLFLINGQYVGGFNKRPAPQEFRANLGLGGTAEPLTPSARELEICARIGPKLMKHGLFFVGIDVVGGFLLEVNATSPTGFPAFNALYKRRLEQDLWDAIVAHKNREL
jgi:glutathione synthase